MTTRNIGLACSLIVLSMLACSLNLFPVTPAPSPTPWPIDEWRFKDSDTSERFRTLDRCIQNTVDNTWHTTSYRVRGNFFESLWCRGTGARDDCQIASATSDNRDQRVIGLFTLFYDRNHPEFFGLGFQSLWVPKPTGWGALFIFAENGAQVVGEGWGVTFRRYTTPTGPPEAIVDLGWQYSYSFHDANQTTLDSSSDLPLREDLALYLSAPEVMRDRGLAHNQALAEKVNTAIKEHQLNACEPQSYQGNGTLPECTPHPFTPSEEAEELARAEAYFDQQEQLLRGYYREMYLAWMTAFPLDQCWP
jgi:hypothetical protein